MNAAQDKLEILSGKLLDEERSTIEALRRLARRLRVEFGWHYLLDLAWILKHLPPLSPGLLVMDAGAGTGMMQWYLAEGGAGVISVDRASRSHLPLRFRTQYRIEGLRAEDLAPVSAVMRHEFAKAPDIKCKLRSLTKNLALLVKTLLPPHRGHILIYNQDLKTLTDLPDAHVDFVVAVSALEHNPFDDLDAVVAELMRVLKPGGMLLATVAAAPDEDWFHQPSQGWCFSSASLRRIFDLSAETPDNFQRYDELLAALRGCAELRDNLAKFYSRSGDNGMPWGVWDPQYQPVGVCKVKN